MQRVKAVLSYDGSCFQGFQRQEDNTRQKTVAGTFEEALRKLNIESSVVGAGRTDTGVHALAQVVHFDIPSFWNDLEKLHHYLNLSIHPSIHIVSLVFVEQTFHARFSAKKRLYRYVLYDGVYQPFLAPYVLHVKPLDVALLHTVTQHFVGTHHFGFFKKEGGSKTSDRRTIFNAGAYRYKQFIILYFFGDAFLRSQIRMMTDMLLKVTDKTFTVENLLAQRDLRVKCSSSLSPACGLYLSRIYY